jgi:hypothetical protein
MARILGLSSINAASIIAASAGPKRVRVVARRRATGVGEPENCCTAVEVSSWHYPDLGQVTAQRPLSGSVTGLPKTSRTIAIGPPATLPGDFRCGAGPAH